MPSAQNSLLSIIVGNLMETNPLPTNRAVQLNNCYVMFNFDPPFDFYCYYFKVIKMFGRYNCSGATTSTNVRMGATSGTAHATLPTTSAAQTSSAFRQVVKFPSELL